MDKLQAYRDKRDAGRTPEPVPPPGGTVVRPSARRVVRDPGAPRPPAALGFPARTRRGAGVLGPAQGRAERPGRQPPGRAHRRSSAGVRPLRGGDPPGRVRCGRGHHLGPRQLRDAEVGAQRGEGHAARPAGHRGVRAVPDQGQPVDDPPGAAGPARGLASHARGDRGGAPRPGPVGAGDEVGRRPGAGLHRKRPGAPHVPDRTRHHGHLSRTVPPRLGYPAQAAGLDHPHPPQATAARRGDRGVRRRRLARVRGAAAADARQFRRPGRPAGRADSGDLPDL